MKITMKKSFLTLLCLLITICSVKAFVLKEIEISTSSPVVPLFKGIQANPLLRIRISISAGSKNLDLKSLSCVLNADGVRSIDELYVYYNNNEPLFSDRSKPGSIKPNNSSIKIPIAADLKPGVHYIWIAAKLKESANIDSKVNFQVKYLEDVHSKKYLVTGSETQDRRLGLAVKKAGDGGVNTFRIPGIATTDKGTLVGVYDIRYTKSGDLPGNIDVGMSRSTDGGRSWEPMTVIMDMGEPNENNGVGDPAILFDPITKKIWVAALWSKGNRSIAGSKPGLSEDITGQLVLVSSADDGKTWTKPYSITAGVKDPKWNIFFNGPGAGIAMNDGKLVFAAQYWDENATPHGTLLYSGDHGETWKTENGPKSNTTETQLIETTPGVLMLNMRDNRGGYRSIATTTDMGKTWTEHHTSYFALQDPVCMASFIKENVKVKGKEKAVVFFGNDDAKTSRINLTIKASLDLGETWKKENQLLIDERQLFGYSSLTKIDDNTLGFLYEGVRDLYFVRIPVSDVIK